MMVMDKELVVIQSFKGTVHSQMKSFSPPSMLMESFVVDKTFLERCSKTVQQRFSKNLQSVGLKLVLKQKKDNRLKPNTARPA